MSDSPFLPPDPRHAAAMEAAIAKDRAKLDLARARLAAAGTLEEILEVHREAKEIGARMKRRVAEVNKILAELGVER